MGKKCIIELEDKPFHKDGEFLYRAKGFSSLVFDMTGIGKLTPYTEPDIEQAKADVWKCARKIAYMYSEEREKVFGENLIQNIYDIYSASEAAKKIRQYEQEKDRQARIEYNFDEIKDVLETTVKECNVSLDEIAEVLQKMRENK